MRGVFSRLTIGDWILFSGLNLLISSSCVKTPPVGVLAPVIVSAPASVVEVSAAVEGLGTDIRLMSAVSASAATPFASNSFSSSSSDCWAYFLLPFTPISGKINGVVGLLDGAKLCIGWNSHATSKMCRYSFKSK